MRTAKPFRRKKRAKRRPMRPAPPTRRTTRFVPRFGFRIGGYFLRRRRMEAAARIDASRRHPDEPLAHSQKNTLAGADAQRGSGRVHLRLYMPVLGRRHSALADLLACDVLARRESSFHEDVRHVPFKEIFGALSRRASWDRRKPHYLCLHRSTRPREPPVELGARCQRLFLSMEIFNQPSGKLHFLSLGMDFARRDVGLHLLDLRRRQVRQERVVRPHRRIRDRHDLAEDLVRTLGDADRVAERLRHLLHAVRADEERERHDDLRLLPRLPHEVAPDEEVEELVRATQLDVGCQRDGVVALAERVEQLVYGNGLSLAEALREVVALEEARDRVFRREADEAFGAEGREPLGVEGDARFLRVEDPEDLRLVCLRVREDLVLRELRARHFLAGGVADHSREVADQEDDRVPEALEVPHLPEDDRVPEMEVRRGRIEAHLHEQGLAGLRGADELLLQLVALLARLDALQEEVELLGDGRKGACAHAGDCRGLSALGRRAQSCSSSRRRAKRKSSATMFSPPSGTMRSAYRLDGSTNSMCMGRTVDSYCLTTLSTVRPRSAMSRFRRRMNRMSASVST